MISLKPLEAVGYNRVFFRLPEEGILDKEFTYYTFDNVYPPAFANYWNIIGLRYRRMNVPLFDIQMMYVDDDELSIDEFHPAQNASRFLWLQPAELIALIQFLEEIVGKNLLNEESTLHSFHLLHSEDLARLNFTQMERDIYKENCYLYIPDGDMTNTDPINLFSLPQWTQRGKIVQGTMLNFATFDRQQLVNPNFRPLQLRGLTTVTFTQQALEEFIILLKHHTYEAALRAFQS